ncbi:MAG TPA: type IV secretion protein IcmD [Coxiellaceae bacterium]|nr:type IV secretion protein IcmD [Coxiellaceae bacterium]
MKSMNILGRLIGLFVGVALVLFADAAWAIKATSIGNNVTATMSSAAKIMQSVALVAGIGFIMVSFFKFHQHKQNPTQVPLSQGLAMLVIGAGLVLLPTLIPTAESVITGTTGNTAKVSGTTISKLIGS